MDLNELKRISIDVRNGAVGGNYSVTQGSDLLRQALIEANGGSTVIDYKRMRKNGPAIFEILEVLLPTNILEGLRGDELYMRLVEERHLGEGDINEFIVEGDSDFVVAEMADGILTPRRQRIGEKTTKSITPTLMGVRFYEELSRILAGRIDWNTFVDNVTKNFTQQLYQRIFTVFSGISEATPGLSSDYVGAGTYSEEAILAIVDHVEAATGKKATIYGTKPALRKCTTAVMSDEARSDYYDMGYYGKLAGVPMVAMQNRHAAGSNNFILNDNDIYILASDDKPIKVVYVGDTLIVETQLGDTADATQNYFYRENVGVGLIVNGKIGKYTIA